MGFCNLAAFQLVFASQIEQHICHLEDFGGSRGMVKGGWVCSQQSHQVYMPGEAWGNKFGTGCCMSLRSSNMQA